MITRRRALIALLSISGLSVTGSLLGLLFQAILAARFGASGSLDAYLFSISAPTFLAALGAAALSYMVTPALVLVEEHDVGRAVLLRRLRRLIGTAALIFALLGLPAAMLQPYMVPTSSHVRAIADLHGMIVIGWTIGAAQLFTSIYTIELNASRRPVWAALLSLPPNLVAIMVVLIGPRVILAAPCGVLIGSLLAIILGTFLTWRSFQPATQPDTLPHAKFGKIADIVWTLLAMSCFSAYAVIDAFWAPRTAEGVLSSLGFAQRLIIGIGSLVVAGPSAILTPRFAAQLRDGGAAAFSSDVRRAAFAVAGFTTLMALIIALIADRLVSLAFGRGAFDAADVARVAVIVRAMLPGFVAMLTSIVLTRAIYCLPSVARRMAFIGIAWSGSYFILSGLFHKFGGGGFGAAYSIAWGIYLTLTAISLMQNVRRAGTRAE